MPKIIQITDTHLLPPGEKLDEIDPAERLRHCLRDVERHHRNADLCVITGDLTDRGDIESYHLFRQILDEELSLPYRLLLGNHDHRENFKTVFPDHKLDKNGFVQSIWQQANHTLIFLDTYEEETHAGGFCPDRQVWLQNRLIENGTDNLYIFMHHPPLELGIAHMDPFVLMEQSEFKACLTPHLSQIRHIFFGHMHRHLEGGYGPVPYLGLRAITHKIKPISDEAGAPFSYPHYAVIQLNAEAPEINLMDRWLHI